jgi:hypothetical protein
MTTLGVMIFSIIMLCIIALNKMTVNLLTFKIITTSKMILSILIDLDLEIKAVSIMIATITTRSKHACT